jgi:hypothetical protein
VEDLGYDVFAAGDAVFEEDEAEDDQHSGARFDEFWGEEEVVCLEGSVG